MHKCERRARDQAYNAARQWWELAKGGMGPQVDAALEGWTRTDAVGLGSVAAMRTSAPSGEVSTMLSSPSTFAVTTASPRREPRVKDAPQRTL